MYEEYALEILKKYDPNAEALIHLDKPDLQSSQYNVEVMILVTEDLAHLTGIIDNASRKDPDHYKNKNLEKKISEIPDTYLIYTEESNIRYIPNNGKIRACLVKKYRNKLFELNEYDISQCNLFICVEECPSDLNSTNYNFTTDNYYLYLNLFKEVNESFVSEWVKSRKKVPKLYTEIILNNKLSLVKLNIKDETIRIIDIDRTFAESVLSKLYEKYDGRR